jgi:hypothetical protein
MRVVMPRNALAAVRQFWTVKPTEIDMTTRGYTIAYSEIRNAFCQIIEELRKNKFIEAVNSGQYDELDIDDFEDHQVNNLLDTYHTIFGEDHLPTKINNFRTLIAKLESVLGRIQLVEQKK